MAKNFLFTSRPRTVPVKARAEALVSSHRSISHSRSSSSIRRDSTAFGAFAARITRSSASRSISSFTCRAVCARTRSSFVVSLIIRNPPQTYRRSRLNRRDRGGRRRTRRSRASELHFKLSLTAGERKLSYPEREFRAWFVLEG